MATRSHTYTYSDLLAMPETPERHEIIDGELLVTASPGVRHQQSVGRLFARLLDFADDRGGTALVGPIDVVFDDVNVVAPDVVYVAADRLERLEQRCMRGAPTIIVEVSSPTTRRTDLTRKLPLYERHRVPEYWFVDLDADRIEIYSLAGERYGAPAIVVPGDTVASVGAPGLEVAVADVLAVNE